MRVIYLSYWSVNSNLTKATSLATIDVLAKTFQLEVIHITIERNETIRNEAQIDGFRYKSGWTTLHKIKEHLLLPKKLLEIGRKENVEAIIANSSLAGSICLSTAKKLQVPLIVEYFEPHSDYMKDSKVWSRRGLRYNYLKYREKRLIRDANYLITVSDNYLKVLLKDRTPTNTLKASAPVRPMSFSQLERVTIRKRFGVLDQDLFGIYVGKFGDIYWEPSLVTKFLKLQLEQNPELKVIVLSEDQQSCIRIKEGLLSFGISSQRFFFNEIPYEEVPSYLSAADFAFTFVKSTPNRQYCAPIKNGKYWAIDLPVVIPYGIGDDSDLIKKHGIGVLFSEFDEATWQKVIPNIKRIIEDTHIKERLKKLAVQFRSLERVTEVYTEILGK